MLRPQPLPGGRRLAVDPAGGRGHAGRRGHLLLLVGDLPPLGRRLRVAVARPQPGFAFVGSLVETVILLYYAAFAASLIVKVGLSSLGNHVYFTFNHEPETALNSSGNGADFIAAWRKVITVFRQRGVTNADYLWIMTAFSFKAKDRRRAVDWYPGEAYLDYIGADAYNWYDCRPGTSNPWNSLESLVNPMRLFAQGKTIKGIMIPEWASTEDPAQPGRKAQWINDARALFKKPGWEGFKGVLYYNKTSKYPNCRWFVDSSQASLTAFAGMANDVYYTRDEP